jgi:hypothetical protein
LVPTATHETPWRPDGGPRASTTTTTTARTTTTTAGTGGATTTTTTAAATGHRTREVHRPLARASGTRSTIHAFALRPTCQGTMGALTPASGSRTTGSRAMPGERQTISSSSRTYRSTLATPRGHGSSTCRGTRSTTRPTYVGLRRQLPRNLHAPRQVVGAAQLQATAGGEPPRVHMTLLQVLHRAPWCDRQRHHLGIPE